MIFHAELDAQALGSVAPESQFQADSDWLQAGQSVGNTGNHVRQNIEMTAKRLAPLCRERVPAHLFSPDMHFSNINVVRSVEFAMVCPEVSVRLTGKLFEAPERDRSEARQQNSRCYSFWF